MLLTSLCKSHGMRVAIVTDLSILRHTVLKLNNTLFEFFRLDFVREKVLAFLWSFGCIDVVPTEVEDFVIDIDH